MFLVGFSITSTGSGFISAHFNFLSSYSFLNGCFFFLLFLRILNMLKVYNFHFYRTKSPYYWLIGYLQTIYSFLGLSEFAGSSGSVCVCVCVFMFSPSLEVLQLLLPSFPSPSVLYWTYLGGLQLPSMKIWGYCGSRYQAAVVLVQVSARRLCQFLLFF